MPNVYICDGVRTPIGRYAGALSSVRADDLAALPIKALIGRNPSLDLNKIDDVILGCANQAGEDNRNIARMASLLAGLPISVPGVTVNRLCGSGLNAIGLAMQAIKAGEAHLILAGGAESMSRAPFVMGKSQNAYDRNQTLFDTTMGWRFINPELEALYGTHTMPETAENLAQKYQISREDQDAFAFESQRKAAESQASGVLANTIVGVAIKQKKGSDKLFDQDEHLRLTPLEKMATLKPIVRENGTISAANASGINDGAAALMIASEQALAEHKLVPRAKILGMSVTGVEPSLMGIGPVSASLTLLKRLGLSLQDMDVIELNEAFAAQALACIREFGLKDDDARINPQGGAIAYGHPLGMSGARIVMSATEQLIQQDKRYALCTMCIGVGQGIAMVIERV